MPRPEPTTIKIPPMPERIEPITITQTASMANDSWGELITTDCGIVDRALLSQKPISKLVTTTAIPKINGEIKKIAWRIVRPLEFARSKKESIVITTNPKIIDAIVMKKPVEKVPQICWKAVEDD